MMNKKTFFLTMTLSLISFLAMLIVYPKLPDVVPTHFGVDGKADGYGQKSILLGLGMVPAGLSLLFALMPRLDPKRKSYEKHKKAYSIMSIFVTLFLIFCVWISVFAGLGHEMNINRLMPLLVAVLFLIIGNFMPQIRQNYFFGIKTPWTLANEYVWRKTHKFGGMVFVIMGILTGITVFLPEGIQFFLYMGEILGGCGLVVLYSYLVYRKCRENGETDHEER